MGTLFDKLLLWEYIYNHRFANFGATATIIPLVDPAIARINATAHNTKVSNASGSDQAVTLSAAPSGWSTPFDLILAADPNVKSSARLHGPAGIPFLIFNGTSERATIPDAAYWSATLDAVSIVFCGFFVATTGRQTVIAKSDEGGALDREFSVHMTATETLQFIEYDETADGNISRATDAAVALSVPLHCAVTMDTGATMANAVWYVNGASTASTAATSGTFVTVQDRTSVVSIGSDNASTPGQYLNGSGLYGGPFGIAFVQAQLTAAQVKKDYDLWRAAMGIG